MRFSATFFVLCSVSSTWARPVDTTPVDDTVQSVEIPGKFKVPCDMSDPRCIALNNIGVHTADDWRDHFGIQTGILTDAAGNAIEENDQPELAKSVKDNGQHLGEEIHSKRENSELNQQAKDNAPKEEFKTVPYLIGGKLEAEGDAVKDLGVGAARFGDEADRQFKVVGNGCQFHCDEAINAVIP